MSGWKRVENAISGDRVCGSNEADHIDGGGWLLVRHVPAGNKWYKATDSLVSEIVQNS